ncbi:DUF4287 domain-containing protein [uncultured Imperialibacter sp.]|uniref:DUF4287 domain-containing protein n=1 Tax=uncultured Imperialibacter sp. TaxID=1672639 RepID=UPI0030D9E396|tara:strand:+ start:432 stop:653 length:222 start_codon:yes stop_codon:yes gene_type:complete
MSFQAYIDNIKTKTGKSPEDFMKELEDDGLLSPDMKATDLVNWLKQNYELGHGHSMAIWAVFKSKGWVDSAKK